MDPISNILHHRRDVQKIKDASMQRRTAIKKLDLHKICHVKFIHGTE
jgi:hypothetical protein